MQTMLVQTAAWLQPSPLASQQRLPLSVLPNSAAGGLRAHVTLRNSASVMTDATKPSGRAVALMASAVLWSAAASANAVDEWGYSTLIEAVDGGAVSSVLFQPSGKVALATDSTDRWAAGQQVELHTVRLIPGANGELIRSLREHKVPFSVVPKFQPKSLMQRMDASSNVVAPLAAVLLPIWTYYGFMRMNAMRDEQQDEPKLKKLVMRLRNLRDDGKNRD
jgi:hypothetical protein